MEINLNYINEIIDKHQEIIMTCLETINENINHENLETRTIMRELHCKLTKIIKSYEVD